jgi:polysaccharide export outer membrane protein
MKIKVGLCLFGRATCRETLASGAAGWRNFCLHVSLLTAISAGGFFLTGCQSSQEQFDAAMAAAATQSQSQSQVQGPQGSPVAYSTNLLVEGDVVGISFRYSTNFDEIQKISLDGTLNLAAAGQVKAANKTVLELQNELTKLYQTEDKDDPITVKVMNPEAAVYVTGSVEKPGKIPLEHPMTVLESIMEAGGSDPLEADLSDVLVLRVEKGQQKTYHINVRRLLDGKDTSVFYLKAFDIVRVPAKIFNY